MSGRVSVYFEVLYQCVIVFNLKLFGQSVADLFSSELSVSFLYLACAESNTLSSALSLSPSVSLKAFFFSHGAQAARQHWPLRLTVSFKNTVILPFSCSTNINSALVWPWREGTW